MNRMALWLVLGLIAVNALIGIGVIISGNFDDLEGKILITSIAVNAGAILALSNLYARKRGSLEWVPIIGAVSSVVGFSLLIAYAWDDFTTGNLARSAATFILIGAGTAHGSLLALGRLVRHYAIVLRAAWVLVALLVGMLTFIIWSDDLVDSETYIRALGVVIVLLAAATLAVPVLHKSVRQSSQEANNR